ncbi:hypothetical protein N7486_001045 [Penicillium sp. IBT 16267x]|nr:hypothetical protein N7486_001045 [Penicillium sp. IBT 16267x]
MSLNSEYEYHLSLLKLQNTSDQIEVASASPIFTGPVLKLPAEGPSQYGLLGGVKEITTLGLPCLNDEILEVDPRLFFNVASPSSTFICGSQGSGKSHTLSCLLEGCLISSQAGKLLNPLSGIIFHYDTFISDSTGSPCEAAFLSSNPSIDVRVLCAPTNLRTIKGIYSRFKNIAVETLQIDQANLNTKRMMDLMAVGKENGAIPLYMHTVQRVLREMREIQQSTGSSFDYADFKRRILGSGLLPGQLEPLKQRLDTLESFMPLEQVNLSGTFGTQKPKFKGAGPSWIPKASQLTVVDLSCPCISPDTACSLFNVCFGIFMEQDANIGRVVALDEAHKYMKDSVEAQNFTETLLSTVRLQRHLGARIFVSTQEPTISSDLLSLCSITIVHRFSSPAWLHALQGHIAAAAFGAQSNQNSTAEHEVTSKYALFHKIVRLRVGEALLFCPNAVSSITVEGSNSQKLGTLGGGYMVIKVRDRLTEDGGKSVISC